MFDDRILNFGGRQLSVGVCDNDSTRSRGLMNVKNLPHDCGMLFVMDECGPAHFWMKNTFVPLDIAFLDQNCRILEICDMEPHVGKSSCGGPVKYVVETNRGWFAENGIMPGDEVGMSENFGSLKDMVSEVVLEMWRKPTCFGDIVYRPFSNKFFESINEMKHRANTLNESRSFDWFHREALSTDIGDFGIYEGFRVPLDIPIPDEFHAEMFPQLHEATKKLPPNTKLNQPKRSGGGTKYHVYVRDPKTGNIKKVGFGAKGMGVGIHDPARVKSFKARHQCEKRNDKTTASYWSCRLPRFWKSLGLKKTSKKWW
jgi:hypothetical protein